MTVFNLLTVSSLNAQLVEVSGAIDTRTDWNSIIINGALTLIALALTGYNLRYVRRGLKVAEEQALAAKDQSTLAREQTEAAKKQSELAEKQLQLAEIETKKSIAIAQPVFELKFSNDQTFYSLYLSFLDNKTSPIFLMYSNNNSPWEKISETLDGHYQYILSQNPLINDGFGNNIINENTLKPAAENNIKIKISYQDKFFQSQWQEFEVDKNNIIIPTNASFAVK